MAVLRLEERGWDGSAKIYEGIVEDNVDLDDLEGEPDGSAIYAGGDPRPVATGSLVLCQEDGKVWLMGSDGTWSEVET